MSVMVSLNAQIGTQVHLATWLLAALFLFWILYSMVVFMIFSYHFEGSIRVYLHFS